MEKKIKISKKDNIKEGKISIQEYKYKESTLSYIWGIIYPVLIYLGVTVLVSVIATIIVTFISFTKKTINPTDFVEKNIMLLNVIIQLITICIILPIYLYSKKKYYPTYKGKIKISNLIIYGIALLGISTISSYLLDLLTKVYTPSDGGIEAINDVILSGSTITSIISVVILAPIMEELLFRGIILNRALSKGSILRAIIISSFLFGFVHLNIIQGINAFVCGIVIAYLYVKTKSLWPCIIAHMFNNAISCIMMNASDKMNNIISIILVLISIYPIIKLIKDKEIQ